MRRTNMILATIVAGVAVSVLAVSSGLADTINFEAPAYTGSADGVAIEGQQTWIASPYASSSVYTYTGNALGLPANPAGGAQFLGAQSGSGSSASTVLHRGNTTINVASPTSYDIAYDFCVSGASTAGNWIAESLVGSSKTTLGYSQWFDWDVGGQSVTLSYRFYDQAGNIPADHQSVMKGIPVDQWLHLVTAVDFASGKAGITGITLTNLTTSATQTVATGGWLFPDQTRALPKTMSLYVGGQSSTTGNIVGFDNLSVTATPEPASLALLGLGGLLLMPRRRRSN